MNVILSSKQSVNFIRFIFLIFNWHWQLHLAAKETGLSNVQIIELNEKLYHNDIYKSIHFIKHIE